jgi:hypothetical protein
MDNRTRAAHVEQRLADGRLPKRKNAELWAGPGTGKPCDGCGEPIQGTEVEHEHMLEAGGILRLHAACTLLWEHAITNGGTD